MAFGAVILILVLLFMFRKLFTSITNAAQEDAPEMVRNTFKAGANASTALPTMGASFATSVAAESLNEVQELKKKIGCTDESIISMSQLHQWMIAKGMF